ncbi:MAG: hypothetical protein AAB573_02005 [Patescibacteria group bacterium]
MSEEAARARIREIYDGVPLLRARLGERLSGGEKLMLDGAHLMALMFLRSGGPFSEVTKEISTAESIVATIKRRHNTKPELVRTSP